MTPPRARLLALGVLAAATTACTYIGQDRLNEQLCQVDEDADGVPQLDCNDAGVSSGILDCNDQDPGINPTVAEVPYDGVDQDCDQLDLVDVDEDGYPGISVEDFLALGGSEDAWPSDVETDTVDCDDNDPDTHPDASDAYYDGVDRDCAGDDDFDADGDGWVPTAHAAAYTGPLQIGDCDDNRADVNPDMPASSDEYYDGVDNDCAGNNDFDKDGDGWMPEEPPFEGLSEEEWRGFFAEYESFYGYDFPDNWGDCREEQDANLTQAGLTPADVWGAWEVVGDDYVGEGAPDTPYDAVDANCDGLNDFDADGDGYMPDQATYEDLFVEFTDNWGLYFEEWGDCDDARDDIHPLVVERLGDAFDHDCDGDVDTTPLTFSEDEWTLPRAVVAGATDQDYVLLTAADEVYLTVGAVTLEDVGRYLLFDRGTSAYQPEPDNQDTWQGAGSHPPLGTGVDAVFGADRFYASTSYYQAGTSTLFIRENAWNGKNYAQTAVTVPISTSNVQYADVDTREAADGAIWSVGCATNRVHFAVGAVDAGTFTSVGGTLLEEVGGGGTRCFVEPDPAGGPLGQAHTCTGSGCVTYDLDADAGSIVRAASQPYAGWVLTDLDTVGETVVLVEPSAGITVIDPSGTWALLLDHTVRQADVSWYDGQLYVAAVVDDLDDDNEDDVVLAYGDPAGTLTEVWIPMHAEDGTATWNAESASVYADDTHVLLGVTGTAAAGAAADTVAWILYDQP